MQIKHRCCYKLQRGEAYPDIGEQLDAIFKLATALKDQGMELPEVSEKWMADVKAVKESFPKE